MLFPLFVLLLSIVFLLDEGCDSQVYSFEVFNHIFEGFLLSHADVFIQMCEFLLDVGHQSIFLLADFLYNRILKLLAGQPLVQSFFFGLEARELLLFEFDFTLSFSDRFEFVILMLAEESAMKTQLDAVSYADDLELFLVDVTHFFDELARVFERTLR